MPHLRIAYVTETYPPEVNGVALTVERTVAHLRAAGHALELIRPRQPGEAGHDSVTEWRTRGMPIPMYPDLRLGLATVSTLRARFERSRPQVVHVATQGPLGRAALVAAAQLGVPVTTDFRTNFHAYSRYYRLGWMESIVRRYLRDFHARAACTFVPTHALAQTLASQGFERLEVSGRGVDAARFSPRHRSARLRASWGVDEEVDDRSEASAQAPVLLYVGRLAAEKNVRVALRAFEAVRRSRPRAQMVVVGDGPLRGRLASEFADARFVGMQRGEALAQHYASADLFLFPSCSETFGNVTLEALASGLATVAFDAAAAAEHIRHGDNGLLAAPHDEDGFIEAACAAATSAARLRRLGARAREQALSLRWDEILGRFDQRLAHHAAGAAMPCGADDAILA